jgi:hypothetical protein
MDEKPKHRWYRWLPLVLAIVVVGTGSVVIERHKAATMQKRQDWSMTRIGWPKHRLPGTSRAVLTSVPDYPGDGMPSKSAHTVAR